MAFNSQKIGLKLLFFPVKVSSKGFFAPQNARLMMITNVYK